MASEEMHGLQSEFNAERFDLGEGELFFSESGSSGDDAHGRTWKILVADDEEDAREAAKIALSGIELSGRPLELLNAASAKEALEILERNQDVAVLLLDVVMESGTAGLDLVRTLRSDSRFDALRIVLRTGQPGYAPELEVAKEYDINDYKAKGELTQSKLVASMASAMRAHVQIMRLRWQNERLAAIAKSTMGWLSECEDEFDVARMAMETAEAALGAGSKAAMGASVERREWLVGSCGLEGRSGMELSECARLGGDLRLAAEELDQALASGSGVAKVGHGRYCQSVSIGSGSMAIWWSPSLDGEHGEASNAAVFAAYCAALSAAMASCSEKDKAHKAAYWDALTELPNRSWLMDRIDKAGMQSLDGMGLMFIDVMGFSEINDALGYDAGDAILKEAAKLLTQAYPGCEIARMPGGAFAVMGLWDQLDEAVALKAFDAPVSAGGWEYQFKLQMGKAKLGGRKSARQALNEANMALNALKAARAEAGSCLEHGEELDRSSRERHKMAKDLKKALRQPGSLSLYYQPQIDLVHPGSALGVEALARWRLADGTMVPPGRFVQVAEQSGLVGHLGDWAMEEACRQAAAWAAGGMRLRIAVNVSPLQLEHPGVFMDKLASCLDNSGVDPELIELEVTEAVAMSENNKARDALAEARSWGCKVALDDFGTGFSSLGRLCDWPLDKIKIDRSLVTPILDEPKARGVIRLIANLGQELGVSVLAEGVETKEQRLALLELGIKEVQGWLYCPALPEQDLLLALKKGWG